MSDLSSPWVGLQVLPNSSQGEQSLDSRAPLPSTSIRQADVRSRLTGQATVLRSPSIRTPIKRIFYLAHDLNDSAIWRRVEQLRRGGAEVKLAGFRRDRPALTSTSTSTSSECFEFGITGNGRPGRRVSSIVAAALRVQTWSHHARDCDIIVARSLEMLALGALLQATFCRQALLVYECLDIHRLIASPHITGHGLRVVERLLLRRCSSLIISSPAFLRHHFEVQYRRIPPVLIWENRMLADEAIRDPSKPRVTFGKPWKIGWFGIIRCERSLRILQSLCLALPGVVEVHIKGRPTQDLTPRIVAATASTPGLIFGGSYDRTRDLPALYNEMHFTWAIDYFEEGANSEWLLPNRLYEGAGHGAVPLALRHVETGKWMLRRAFGVCFDADPAAGLLEFFRTLDAERYQCLFDEMNAVDATSFVQPDNELASFVQRLGGLIPATAKHR